MHAASKLSNIVEKEIYSRFCTCGQPHPPVATRHYIGNDAFDVLAADCYALNRADRVFVLNDENTYQAAGKAVVKAIEKRGLPVTCHTLTGKVTATEALAQDIADACQGCSKIIAVGSGTINDLGKFAAHLLKTDYWTVPTAPSMNGYTSAIAAIKVAGVKRTLPAPPPTALYTHPEVIATAPKILRQAGYCDVLAKAVSDIDWQIESAFFSDSYCSLPSKMVSDTEKSYFDHPEAILSGDRDTIMGLFKGLLISGVAMSVAGSSAPASGGEHLFSHFLDMQEKITGRKPKLHGLQVAGGIVLSAACYHRLASVHSNTIPQTNASIIEQDAKRIPEFWGDLADEVNRHFALKKDQLLRLNPLMIENKGFLADLYSRVPPPEEWLKRIHRVGFPLSLLALDLNEKQFLAAARYARTIRERITVLDLAAQAGVLDDAVNDTLRLLR